MLLFATLGGLGCYLFLRLQYCHWTALVCGLLFANNGYHVARMLEGHFGHHGFMLVPLIAWLIARNHASIKTWFYWRQTAWVALGLAYLILCGAAPILPQIALTLLLFLTFARAVGIIRLRQTLVTLLVASIVSMLLLGPILLATLSFMHWNPRTWAPLPQFASIADSFWYGTNLILSPLRDTPALWENVINPEALLEWHEFEYGLTAFPLLVMLAFAYHRYRFHSTSPDPGQRFDGLATSLFITLTILPFLANGWLGETFVEFVRGLPLLGSTSNLFRWYVVPMCAVLLITASLLEQLLAHRGTKTGVVVSSTLLAIITAHYAYIIKPAIDSRSIRYENSAIESAYLEIREAPNHKITQIGASYGVQRNDTFIHGVSQLLCYEAALGYRLQGMRANLAIGPIESIDGNRYNMADPSCYVYPHENACTPGERFTTERRKAMLEFAQYSPLSHSVSRLHESLSLLSRLTLGVMVLLLIQPLLARCKGLLWPTDRGRYP
jgi:hypothetical protein